MGEQSTALRYKNSGNPSLLLRVPGCALRVLDIGCGAGDNARILAQRGHRVWGVTSSADEAAAAAAYCEHVWTGDIENMSLPTPPESFDALVMSHVLEHLVAPQQVLRAWASLLIPDGWLVIAVPNMAHWRVRWRILLGDWRREDTGFFDRTHLQFWSYETISDTLASTPFRIEAVSAADPGMPLRPLRRAVPRLAAWLDAAAGRIMPNLAGSQVVVVARRVQ